MDRRNARWVLDILAEVERREAAGGAIDSADIARASGAPSDLVTYVLCSRERGQPPRLLGRYGLVEAIGHGAMGVVWWARDFELARDVALKELPGNHARNPEALRRFRREAAAAARLTHPNLLPIHEIGSEDDTWFYSMKLVDGSSLHEQVEMSHVDGTGGPAGVGPTELADFLEQYACVADAVQVAHEAGVFHRDIKPSNIMVDEDGTLLLVDFGLARDTDRIQMTVTGTSLGTPMYMSPEQFTGRSDDVDARTDVYALGITLYEVLTLQAPYSESNLEEMTRQILGRDPATPKSLGLSLPRDLEHIVFRAIEKDPDRRYDSAADFAADLRNFIHDRPVDAHAQSRLVRLRKGLRRNRSTVRTTVLTATLLVVASGLVWTILWWSAHSAAKHKEGILLQGARARLAQAERANEAGQREAAQIAWIRTFEEAPATSEGHLAMLSLASSLIQEGQPKLAVRAASLVRRAAPDASGECRALLLTAEALLGQGMFPEALGHLEAAEGRRSDLPGNARQRAADLREAVDAFGERRMITVPSTTRMSVGRFRGAQPLLLLAGSDATHVVTLDDGRSIQTGFSRAPLEHDGRTFLSLEPAFGVADFDHDGTDEVVRITHHNVEAPFTEEVQEHLEILDLRSVPPRIRFSTRVPHATHNIHVGDFDNDTIPDLLIGMSWPVRGVLIMRGRQVSSGEGTWSFVELPAEDYGDMAFLRNASSDIRMLRVGDVTGDGKNEVAVAADRHDLHAVFVFRYEPGRGFIQLGDRVPAGSVLTLELAQLDGDPETELLFGMSQIFTERSDPTGWPLQGLHVLDFELGERRWQRTPFTQFERLRLRDRGSRGPRPTNLGYPAVSCGYLGNGKPFAAARVQRYRGKGFRGSLLQFTVKHGTRSSSCFLGSLDAAAHSAALAVEDIDDDRTDEILWLVDDTVRIYGSQHRGSPVPPLPPPGGGIRSASPRLSFELAGLRYELEFFREAVLSYKKLLPSLRGKPEETVALERIVSSLKAEGDLEQCAVFLEAQERADTHLGYTAARDRAVLLERLGLFVEAREAYEQLAARVRGPRYGAKARAAELTPWTSTTAIPIPPLAGSEAAVVSREGIFEIVGRQGVRVTYDEAGAATLQVPLRLNGTEVLWRGESFRLVCDLRVHNLQESKNLSIGFFDFEARDWIDQCLCVRLASTTGQHRGLHVLRGYGTKGAKAAAGSDSTPGHGLPVGPWYRIVLLHDASSGTSRVVARERESGRLVSALECRGESIPEPRGYGLGIHAGHCSNAKAMDVELALVSLQMVR